MDDNCVWVSNLGSALPMQFGCILVKLQAKCCLKAPRHTGLSRARSSMDRKASSSSPPTIMLDFH